MQGSIYTPFCAKTLARTGKLMTSICVGEREFVLTCRKNGGDFSVKLLGDTLIHKSFDVEQYGSLAQALVEGYIVDNYSDFIEMIGGLA